MTLMASLAMVSCDGAVDERTLTRTLNTWFQAIHDRDFERLARYDAAAPIARDGEMYDAWVRAVEGILDAHLVTRDAGRLEPDEKGYRLVVAAQLGRGAFWERLALETGPDGPKLIGRITFGYGEINYVSLPRGSTVYLLGHPLGTIFPVELGEGQHYTLDVIETLDFVATFSRPADPVDGDAEYKVDALTWSPGTETHGIVHWIF